MIVFLDFDGVLRRDFSPPGCFENCCLEPFCEALRALSQARIVISSGWRLAASLEDLRRHFPADIAERIEGLTPVVDPGLPHARYHEVRLYLHKAAGPNEPWIAVEDDPNHFPPGMPNVILLDPARGFDDEAKRELLSRAR